MPECVDFQEELNEALSGFKKACQTLVTTLDSLPTEKKVKAYTNTLGQVHVFNQTLLENHNKLTSKSFAERIGVDPNTFKSNLAAVTENAKSVTSM